VANKQYNLMTWDDLYALGPQLKAVAAPDCAIFMWTTAPLLMETAEMVKAWRLRYVEAA
jgi:N6-adenosine-specific RNA methylase IME4